MFVSDVQEKWFDYKLPYEFVKILPSVCPVCGSPTEMSEVLTRLHCSNPRCPDKVVMRIKAICQKLGVLGFGESTISDFVEAYDVTNPLNVFNLSKGMFICDRLSQESADKIIVQLEAKKDFQLWEYVQIAQLPYVQSCAKDIFGGFSSLEEAYAAIEYGGVDYIQKCLGIGVGSELSVRAMQVYSTLLEFKDDLFECLPDVHIISMEGKVEVNIYCSDSAGGVFAHKKDFYEYIEKEFGSKFHFNVAPINKKLNYLVWAGADGTPCEITSKVQKVMGYQEKGIDIPIMTASQFIEEFKGKM